MTLDEIKQLIDFIRERDLSEFELERADFKLRIKSGATVQAVAPPVVMAAPAGPIAAVPAAPVPTPSVPPPAAEVGEDLAIVTSPIVGTFYRSPEPGAPPYTDVGQAVKKGQVLCLIEAMKLMNEINAEVDGEVVKVYVENNQAVQYGERLFAIRPA